MELKGKVHFIGETIQVSDKFKKRELILEYVENPQYPEYVKFEAVQDKTALLDNFKIGNEVEVFFNLKGREWADKNGIKQYFNSLHVWKINFLGAGVNVKNAPEPVNVAEEDLPF